MLPAKPNARLSMTSRQRVIDHGEVFTPQGLVSDMLDLVNNECERIDSRFLEPACGNGNFLAEVLRRKLRTVDSKENAKNPKRWMRDAVLAVCSIYGIDLLADNVGECHERMLGILTAAFAARFREPIQSEDIRAVAFILSRNIVQGDALTLLTTDGRPIVFSEWSPVNGYMLKRRDFKFAHLLGHAHVASQPLFSDLGEEVFQPQPVGERPPCHYQNVGDGELVTAVVEPKP